MPFYGIGSRCLLGFGQVVPMTDWVFQNRQEVLRNVASKSNSKQQKLEVHVLQHSTEPQRKLERIGNDNRTSCFRHNHHETSVSQHCGSMVCSFLALAFRRQQTNPPTTNHTKVKLVNSKSATPKLSKSASFPTTMIACASRSTIRPAAATHWRRVCIHT